ncbi:MAG: 30S ribosomal protein S12 methylthiotransferase RimO [Clostridiales Family XIII bacterium]|jgi:ribosomal protein S12 methylthiotransferase|nr:30S ribosomal protein S12 methylthiotransferase RimO [Clostridiales Family XIII bacterium]
MRTVYIETLGCPKNVCDSEFAAGVLADADYRAVDDPADASVILVNTCGFIDDAKRESIESILELAACKEAGSLLVVSGCLSQRYGEELARELPEVDLFLGVGDYARIADILDARLRAVACAEQGAAPRGGGRASGRANRATVRASDPAGPAARICGADGGVLAESPAMPRRKRLGPAYTAFLKVAEGCDNRCAYCVIPDIRGPYRSRALDDVLREGEALARGGAAEIILIAQDLTNYGADLYGKPMLARLVRELCKTDGLRWLRLMYCYEDRVTEELIEAMASEEKVCHYIDLPLQHASDRVLAAMGRRSDKAGMLRTIARLRAAVPDIHIRTTLITGFPSEGKADFEELMDFAETVRFERLGVFAYSCEEGTPAASMKGQVREAVKLSRRDRLLRLQQGISLEKNQEKIGQTLEVLVEGCESDGSFSGRTRYDAPEIDNGVIFGAPDGAAPAPGDIVRVRIDDAFDYDLSGYRVAL